MIDSAAAWGPGDSGIKPVKDAGRSQYWMYWRARGRRSGADHPDSSGTRGRGINHQARLRPMDSLCATCLPTAAPDGQPCAHAVLQMAVVNDRPSWVNTSGVVAEFKEEPCSTRIQPERTGQRRNC